MIVTNVGTIFPLVLHVIHDSAGLFKPDCLNIKFYLAISTSFHPTSFWCHQ